MLPCCNQIARQELKMKAYEEGEQVFVVYNNPFFYLKPFSFKAHSSVVLLWKELRATIDKKDSEIARSMEQVRDAVAAKVGACCAPKHQRYFYLDIFLETSGGGCQSTTWRFTPNKYTLAPYFWPIVRLVLF